MIIVTYLFYRIYKLLKGTLGFNIFIGVLLLYVVSWIVNILQMKLLSQLLGSFVSLGLLIVVIIFQPEVRRFLLMLGNTTLKGRMADFTNFINKQFNLNDEEYTEAAIVSEIYDAVLDLSKEKTGALIVLTELNNVSYFSKQGVVMDAKLSSNLIRNVFAKNAPLHDGAMIIADERIHSAGVVLPLTDGNTLDQDLGLRHRAALGVTEIANAHSIVVSEETGHISFASNGKLKTNLTPTALRRMLKAQLKHKTI